MYVRKLEKEGEEEEIQERDSFTLWMGPFRLNNPSPFSCIPHAYTHITVVFKCSCQLTSDAIAMSSIGE